MPCSRRPLATLAPLLVLACQGGPPPDLVRVELPELVTSEDPVRPNVFVRRGGTSKPLDEPATLGVSPGDLASVRPDGTIACAKSGDGKLTVTVKGVVGERTLACRLVERIELDDVPLLDVAGSPVTLAPRAVTKAGKTLADVPIALRSQSPRLLAASGLTLTPLAVGETSFTLTAGTRERKVPVRIVKTLSPEALPLEGGRRIFFSLGDGKYEVEVTLPTDKPLAVEWRGAPYCAYRATAKTHKASCVLQGKGGAVIDNPAFLLTGTTEVSREGVALREVP
jgi:hypothetical protein